MIIRHDKQDVRTGWLGGLGLAGGEEEG